MQVYLQVAARTFQRHLAYRAANLAGLATNLFFGAVYVSLYRALYWQRETAGGLDAQDAVTYATVTQALLMVMTAFGNRELSERIVRGDIAIDLGRPLDLYRYWGAVDLGRAAYYLLFRGLPTWLLGLWLFRASLPATPLAALLVVAALAGGMLVSFAFRFVVSSLAFVTVETRGIQYLSSAPILFLSGFIIPLNFLPEGARAVVEWLPFASMAHLPVSVYLGKVAGAELLRAMVVQAAWFLLLTGLGRLLLRHTLRRLPAFGG